MGVEQWEGAAGFRWPHPHQASRSSLQCSSPGFSFVPPVSCSPLGQHHDTNCIRQLLCPDPSCEVCNNATTEIHQLLYSEGLEESTPSVSPWDPTASSTEPLFTQSSAISAVPPGDLIPPPLPEPFPPPPSVLSPNPMTPVGSFLSHSSPGQTLSPEPFPPLELEFPLHHSPFQPKDLLSSTLTQCDFHQEFSASHCTKTFSGGNSAAKRIDPRPFLFLSSDEHGLVQQYSYPKNWEDLLKKKIIQLFWGLPSLHSESLASAVHVSNDYSSVFIFNSISNDPTGQESLSLPYFLPEFLPKVQPQPLPPTLPQSQPLHLTQIQHQANLQSPFPILPSSPTPQLRDCGVYFHRPQNESYFLTSSEIQDLEWNVLKKKQESLWGLPSVVQSSREAAYPSAPTIPYSNFSSTHVSISISPVEFPLSSELRKKFEHHFRKKLIQHRWGLPRRVHESLSLMKPLRNRKDISESKSSYGLSWISVYKDQSSKNINIGFSQQESFYEKGSEIFQLEKDEGPDEGESQGDDPKDYLLSESGSSSDKDVRNDCEKDLDSYMMNLPGGNSKMSGQSISPKQLRKSLKEHLSKNLENINEGHLPGIVHSSWHNIVQTSPVKPHTNVAQRSAPAPVGGDYCLNTSQELSFLESSTQQMLEAHITSFGMSMLLGLPAKVLESIEIFKKNTSFHSLFNPKSRRYTALRGSSESLHGDKVRIENSATVLKLPLPATSLVGSDGQGALKQSPSDIKHELAKEVQRDWNSEQPLLPVTDSIIDNTIQSHALIPNVQPPQLSTMQAGTRHEPKDNSVNASDNEEILQSTNGEKLEPASMPTVSKETVSVEELDVLQSSSSDILTTSNPGIPQEINEAENKGETTGTTELSPIKLSILQDPKLSELQKQLIHELKSKLENGNYSQAQGQPTDMHHDSESLICKASLTHAQSVSSVDPGAVQVLHVHLEDKEVSMEQQQEPWVPKQVLRMCEDKNSQPDAKKVRPAGSRSEELGGGDAGLRTSQARGKRFPSQVTALEVMHAGKPPQTLSQKGQSPDSHFLSKIKTFFQWLYPDRKCTKQEISQEKCSPILSAQSRGPIKSRTPFTRRMEVQRIMSDTERVPEEKQRRRHAVDTTCTHETLPRAVKFGKAQQKAAVGIWAEPVQGHPFNLRAPSSKVMNIKCSCQAASFTGQSSTSSRHIGNEGRHPQKVVALKDQQLCQKHPQSVPRRGTVPRPSPTYRPQAAQGPPAALTTAEGTEFRDQSLRLRPKTLPQNVQGKKIPTPK
ncbi:spermatogenesis-associated protein 31D1-like [Molossus molossus]|uniref:spermatogenesis-associated protein 31D1-like n=1 Tax=Molossus molossus TaxID=27622 RepID=UPI0017465137|nr:spermatogenesis-associated protein 31D1-like [Molossus molossus]